MESDKTVVIAGVSATVACIRNAEGVPVLALDDAGNLGVLGEVRTTVAIRTSSASSV